MSFATRLRVARLSAGLTQAQAADDTGIIGITRHTWSRMECGHSLLESTYKRARKRCRPGCAKSLYRRIDAIADAVNTTPEHLLGEEE